MGNGTEKIAKDWKETAAVVLEQNPHFKAPQILRQLKLAYGEEKSPGLSAVQKEVPLIRERLKTIQESGIEELWNLGTLKDHPLSAETVTAILKVQKWAEKRKIERAGRYERHGMTIRQAIWIGRLYDAVREFIGKDAEHLWCVSYVYTMLQIISDISDTPLNTWEWDQALRKGDMAFRTKIHESMLHGHAVTAALIELHMASETIAKRGEK